MYIRITLLLTWSFFFLSHTHAQSQTLKETFPFQLDFEAEWIMKIGCDSLTDSIVTYENYAAFTSQRYLDYLSGDTLFSINNIDYWGVRGYIINSINVATGEVYWQHLTYEPITAKQWEIATRPTFTTDTIFIPLIVEVPTNEYPFGHGYSWEEGNLGLLTLDRKTGAVLDKFISDYYHEGNLVLTPPYVWKYYDNYGTDLFYLDGMFGYYRFTNGTTYYPDFNGWDSHHFTLLNIQGEVLDSFTTQRFKYSNVRSKVLSYTDDLSLTASTKYEVRDSNAILMGKGFHIDKYNKYMQITDSLNLTDIGEERIDFHAYNHAGDLLIHNYDTSYHVTSFYIMDWDKNIKWQAPLDSVGGLDACFYEDGVAVLGINKDLDSRELGIYITDKDGVFQKRMHFTKKREQSVLIHQILATDDGGILINFDCSDDYLPPLGWTRDNYWIKFSKEQLFRPSSTEKVTSEDITIYPNPSSDFIHVSSLDNITGMAIINGQGRLIRQVGVQESIDISDLPAGTYYLRQDFKQGAIYKRFVKF